ncbi:MAG TPA: LLM class F420-dependent oxidoreductase [Myxococcota bacterium]|nr:LLM class F420-dependent oxidoreductase [Myxococcota bacterium]
MRIGLMVGATDGPGSAIDGLIAAVKRDEAAGFPNVWMANIFGLDAVNALALVGRETARIELGTAVVPTYPRHPFALAQQALTTQAASRGRFALGIGLSHKIVIETMLGMSYDKPARHMREYLRVIGPLLRGEGVQFQGEQYRVAAQLQVPGATRVPLLVAALGPTMLRLTGELADGTITWMTGPKTLASHVIPLLREAAKAAGRAEPRIVAGFPVVVTHKPDEAREKIAKALVIYGQLPSYRAMLDREGASGPADIALAGDEGVLRRELARLRELGVTDFSAAITAVEDGAEERTRAFLASELGSRR